MRRLANTIKVYWHCLFRMLSKDPHSFIECWEGNWFYPTKYHIQCECGYSPDGDTFDSFWDKE